MVRITPVNEKALQKRINELERLFGIIERGKQMWESTFDAITQPVQIVSADYTVERANVAVANIAGVEIRDVIGKKCYDVFAGRKKPCGGCPMKGAIRSKGADKNLLKEDVHSHEFEANAFPYNFGNDGHTGAVVYYRDVTEEKRLQREVVQQEKMAAIGVLAGGVAHEINNPLSGIIAFAQLMKKDIGDNKSLEQDLHEIEEAAQRCKKIVADLLDYSRVSKEQEKCQVDVNVLIEKVFPFVTGELKSYNIEISFDKGRHVPLVTGNPNRLQQVFLNLLTNACHSMPKGGNIKIRTLKNDNFVDIVVEDSGSGIKKENLDKIFDPFFTTKEPGKGTGLGLSISYRIVKEHGGDLKVVSSEIGKGTKFLVQLPVAGVM